MNLVDNEQTKLLAGALDRVSIVCVTVGIATPLSGLLGSANGLSVSLVAACYI